MPLADDLDGNSCSMLLTVGVSLLFAIVQSLPIHVQYLSYTSCVAARGATAQPIMLGSQPRSTARTEPFVLEYD